MNRKFSTLLAGVLSAFVLSFTASAATAIDDDEFESGSTYLLGSSSFLYVETTSGTNYGKLYYGSVDETSLTEVLRASWKVTATTSTSGTIYTFVNKLTGVTLAVDPTTAPASNPKNTIVGTNVSLGGTVTEWALNDDNVPYAYLSTDSVIYITENGYPYKESAETFKEGVDDGATVEFCTIDDPIVLTASDLNTMLLSSTTETGFTLSMSPEVSDGQDNLFTESTLFAVGIAESEDDDTFSGYVKLEDRSQDAVTYKKVTYYQTLTVDTAYYEGTENSGKLRSFTFDYPRAYYEVAGSKLQLRDSLSTHFKFEYNVTDDEVYVSVEEAIHMIEITDTSTKSAICNALDETGGSYWPTAIAEGTVTEYSNATQEVDNDIYLYMASLVGTKVLTVYDDAYDADEATNEVGQNITITVGTSYSGLTQTTLSSGVYTIKYLGLTAVGKGSYAGKYLIANLAGEFGYAEEATRQDFTHMPAAQWVVAKNGSSSTSTITLTNREFADQTETFIGSGNPVQLYTDDSGIFYLSGSSKVYLSFTAVSDPELTDGYLYLSEEETSVQTYTFNYLHGLSLSTYLNTTDDAYVQVDADGEKTNYRLNIVVKDDHYGIGDSLLRNVYTIESIAGGSYLTYSTSANKFVMGSTPTYFFLKENNCIDGAHYYTLVEANLLYVYDTDGNIYAPEDNGAELDDVDALAESYTYVSLVYDADGQPIVNDSEISEVYAYVADEDEEYVTFDEIDLDDYTLYTHSTSSSYYVSASTSTNDDDETIVSATSKDYAHVKASVDDNTLYLVTGVLDDKFESEARTSAFAVAIDDSPLYRRFNNADLGEDADDGEVSLAFVETIRGEYLMDEYNENLLNDEVDYAGMWTTDKADGKLFFHVDTAWLNRGNGTIKPQYLLSVARNDQSEVETVPCTEDGVHITADGEITDDPYECIHATSGRTGFIYGKYLVNLSDSAVSYDGDDVNPYVFSTSTASQSAYTRVGFVPAIHYGDSLIILVNGYEDYDPEDLNPTTIIAAYTKAKCTEYIVDLTGDEHKNVTWSFRYVNPDDAGNVTEEGEANEFLFESNVYGDDDTDYQTVEGDATKAIAPSEGVAWLKLHNGCLVLTDATSTFSAAQTGGDGALVFNVVNMAEGDDYVTSTEEIAVEGVTVVAGTGVVTIKGAAGKSVVITNILGKAVANTTLTSDSQTISVPAGIVVVAVEGEDAVKTIVK